MTPIFSSIITAKNGEPVPVFRSGKSMHSRYDPEKEGTQAAERTAEAGFFIVAGIGGGYFIRALKKRFPLSFILAVENSRSDIDFLKRISVFNNLCADDRVRIVPVEMTADTMLRLYVPAFYGSFSIIEMAPWANENKSGIESFRAQTKKASLLIAADYSAQAHFGKIWQRNIITNLALCGNFPKARPGEHTVSESPTNDFGSGGAQKDMPFGTNEKKRALIAAAGPSLDTALPFIEKKRSELYIVATDTAYKSFAKRGIRCDAVVSIDGQLWSAQHFFTEARTEDTLFVFDLCANPGAVRFIKKTGGKIAFVRTGHPLASYASSYSQHKTGIPFPYLEPGAGTVTIAALDFALKAGFTNIAVCGADFSYSEKPYVKGTYLDALYNSFSCRTRSSETAFGSLMFRTELIGSAKRRTTQTLDAYRKTFESVLFRTCEDIEFDGLFYRAVSKKRYPPLRFCTAFDMRDFISFFKNDFSHSEKKFSYPDFSPAQASLFPAVSHLRKTKNQNSFAAFPELLKLAYAEILRYTRQYET